MLRLSGHLPILFSNARVRRAKLRIAAEDSRHYTWFVKRAFFIVGPTATGKSELAADVARAIGGEIVNVDAFQIYRGLDLLTAKPEAATLTKASHHLIGTMSLSEEMSAETFRRAALHVIEEIRAREKLAIVVGGSGLYLKALTHGLSVAIPPDLKLRAELNQLTLEQLRSRLIDIDPEIRAKIDLKNRRRIVRALEIALTHNRPAPGWPKDIDLNGVFVFRNREELHARINQRVQEMFENGVVEEVRAIEEIGTTAAKTIGLREIREHLKGETSLSQCIAAIQQATRRYAKRQLTWFRHQTSFEPLNLSLLTQEEAVAGISQRAMLVAKG
jgi:tRNA dimethylallyltransferase